MTYIVILRHKSGLLPIFDTDRETGLAKMTEYPTRETALASMSSLGLMGPDRLLVYEVSEPNV